MGRILHQSLVTRTGLDYCWRKRKNKLPAGEGRVMELFVPSLESVAVHGVQLVEVKSEFCCKVQPRKGLFQ